MKLPRMQDQMLDSLRATGDLGATAAAKIEQQRETILSLQAKLDLAERQVRDQARELKRIRDNIRAARKLPA